MLKSFTGKNETIKEDMNLAKGTNQKLKLIYLMKIMLEETDEEHRLTMPEIISELNTYDISAERKSVYNDIAKLPT